MYEYAAKILKVVDGDTVDVELDLGLSVYHRVKIRLYGINAPEMNTDAGKIAKKALQDLLPDGLVTKVTTIKDRKEKYGRYLGVFKCVNGTDANRAMVELGHAVDYMIS
jgi:micrococcal nuclease